jgi:hypothetical protein
MNLLVAYCLFVKIKLFEPYTSWCGIFHTMMNTDLFCMNGGMYGTRCPKIDILERNNFAGNQNNELVLTKMHISYFKF